MEARAVAKYIRMSPQKVRLVVDLVRGKKVEEAKQVLLFTRKYAAGHISKVLNSALANAKQNPNIDENILYRQGDLRRSGSFPEALAGKGSGKSCVDKKTDESYNCGPG